MPVLSLAEGPQSVTMPDFQTWASAHQQRFEDMLRRLLPQPGLAPQRLHEAMRYSVLDGGKRVRPLPAFTAGELVGAATCRYILKCQTAANLYPTPTSVSRKRGRAGSFSSLWRRMPI